MYNAKKEEVDQGKGNGSGGAQIPVLNKMSRVGLTKKMTFDQRLEGGNWRHGSRWECQIGDFTGAWEQTPWNESILGLDEYTSVHAYKLFFWKGT